MRVNTEDIAEFFKVLSDPTRLRIITLLSSKRRMFCVRDLAHRLGVSQPAVSQHLRILKHMGILMGRRRGCCMHYSFNPAVLVRYKKEIDKIFRTAFECCGQQDADEVCCNQKKGGD